MSGVAKAQPDISASTLTTHLLTEWFIEDSTAQQRVDWLKSASECTQYADNKILRESSADFVAKTSFFPRLINTTVGMLVRATLQPQAISNADNTLAMTEPVTSFLQWQWNSKVSVEMLRLWYYDLVIRGMGIKHVEFDEKLCDKGHPLGDVRISIVSPRNMFYDRWARTSEDVKRLSVVHWVARRDAIKRWGNRNFSRELPENMMVVYDSLPLVSRARDTEWEAIPIVEPLWCDTVEEQWIYPSVDDANALSGVGIQCEPGVLMKPPDDYLMTPQGQLALVRPREIQTWMGTYYNTGVTELLEEVKPTFTGNNPYITTIAFPVENSPQGIGLVHHVRGTQFATTTLDTINLRLMLDSQTRFTLINAAKLTSPTQGQDIQNMLDGQSARASVVLNPKPDDKGNTDLNGIIETIEPKPITAEYIELAKYFGEMIGTLSGISDWSVGAFPASDSGVKSRLRQQSQIPQLDPMFVGVEGGFEKAFNEMFAILRKTHTQEMMFPDRTSFGNRKQIPLNKYVQSDSAETYAKNGHLVADDGNGGFVVNPIALADGFTVRVRVNTMSNADKYEQVESNRTLATEGYIPKDEVLEPHPVFSASRKELLSTAQEQAQQAHEMFQMNDTLLGAKLNLTAGELLQLVQSAVSQSQANSANSMKQTSEQGAQPGVPGKPIPPPPPEGGSVQASVPQSSWSQ